MSLDVHTIDEPDVSAEIVPRDKACPVCDGHDYRFLFTKLGRTFWRCLVCRTERIWPLPGETELEAYYESSYQSGMYQAFAGATEMKRLTATARYRQIARHCRTGRWLDVGCSTGMFAEQANRHQNDCQGIDLSPTAVEQAQSLGLQASCGTLSTIEANAQFDNITAFDVLEHVTDPLEFVSEVYDRLVPGGTLAITVPNLHSLSRRVMGRRWYFYIPEEHLHYFTPDSLSRLLNKVGFKPICTKRTYKPLTFDYSLLQFKEYNPWVYRILAPLGKVLPRALREKAFPLFIGEMLIVARKPISGNK